MNDNNREIPQNATIRQEYIRCGNPDCQNSHGPYLYAYWKQDRKLKKRYVGKNLEDFGLRKIAKEIKLRPSELIKFKFIEQEASKGNVLAKQYLEKLRKEEVSIDWAHKKKYSYFYHHYKMVLNDRTHKLNQIQYYPP
jgi:hypothetical protein